jgi:hypothetical protein
MPVLDLVILTIEQLAVAKWKQLEYSGLNNPLLKSRILPIPLLTQLQWFKSGTLFNYLWPNRYFCC